MKRASLSWEGNSLEILRSFPKSVKEDVGGELARLQRGERPLRSRPFRGVGKGVFEVKDQDESHWYRVIYISRIDDVIYVLHTFQKKSGKTSRKDIRLIGQRYRNVMARIREKRSDNKKKED